ncbi:cold, circadian rhythm, and RNA binding 1 [Actinidia rufa]|uniref:Cold, circadian rhythm, and RNA binding 1 n=1 Tax=Actinidia rufa TaxID=165716 RepID=A0A7J0D9F9_9ERIC|nr:cold, circadian rhythm, and RNA binding 1 [Actinidia rufa]
MAVGFRCFVGGLPWATDNRSLESAFALFGDVVESKIINDRETGRSRGFGYVTFNDERSMRAAIEVMNGQKFDGRIITVKEAQSRGSGGGGFRGGGGLRGGGGRREGFGYSLAGVVAVAVTVVALTVIMAVTMGSGTPRLRCGGDGNCY